MYLKDLTTAGKDLTTARKDLTTAGNNIGTINIAKWINLRVSHKLNLQQVGYARHWCWRRSLVQHYDCIYRRTENLIAYTANFHLHTS
ncbi:hypothetical protein AVEN_129140-1, partial [Araneus ventricosus]